ncbi:MAG: GldG family protein [Kiritimatiellae bacterium]|nr:GldG family protein [Kiritimatiellia bacterium]
MTSTPPASPPPSLRDARRFRRFRRIDRALSVVLALLVWGLLLYLASRHPLRLAAPSAGERPLASKTLRLLSDLDDAVSLRILLRPDHPAAAPTRALAARLAASPAPIAVEFVDPDRDLAHAEELCARYGWSGGEALFLESAASRATIPADSLLDYAADPADPAAPPLPLFRGESLVAGAIYSLVNPSRPVVCFLQGHGERSPDDFDRRRGFSEAAALLRDDLFDVETLRLDEAKAVPARCALLVVAGPATPLSPDERALLRDYLDRKGRLLLLLDARSDSGCAPLLREWDVALDDDLVFDESHSLNGLELHLSDWAPDHPVTASLAAPEPLHAVFYLPRSVRPARDDPAAPADRPRVTTLLATAPSGFAARHPNASHAPRFDPATDLPGPVPVAVAVERGPQPGVHTQLKPTRIVVVGDSDFASNGGLRGANASFFLNAANWLAERPDFLGVAPQPLLLPTPVSAGADALRRLFLCLAVLLPAAVVLPLLIVLLHHRATS